MSSKEPPADEGETSASTHPFRVEGVWECDRVQAGSEDSCVAQVETMAGTMTRGARRPGSLGSAGAWQGGGMLAAEGGGLECPPRGLDVIL